MKCKLFFLSLVLSSSIVFGQKLDSLKFSKMEKEIIALQKTNETLQNSLKLTTKTLNDLVRDKKVSAKTKWEMISSNIIGSVELYKLLSDDIINLKSRIVDEDYQGFIRLLGSVQGGPLGFSFQKVIIETAQNVNLFSKKSKMDRFITIAKNIINSPIVSSIPFVSGAVSASSSILNIAYSVSMSDKKADLHKLKQFEIKLNNYISYYAALDKANIQNLSSTSDRRVLLENLQIDLINKLKKDALKLKYTAPKRKEKETIDDYFNRILIEFNKDYSENFLKNLENKYKNKNNEIDYSMLLKKELDLKYYNNSINVLVEISKKYILYYDNYFEIAENYQNKIIQAVDLARANGIIRSSKINGIKQKPEQVYNNIIQNLTTKKRQRDNIIRSSINIQELKQKMESVEEFKII